MSETNLINGDCLKEMDNLPYGSVDMVLTDPPYGTTACKWDSIIPLEPMWEQLKRVIKPNGAIVMTASQPFTTTLIASNMKMFKYCWVWDKKNATNFMSAKLMPLLKTEDICIFSLAHCNSMSKNNMPYNPQGTQATNKYRHRDNAVGGAVGKERKAVFKGDYTQKVTGYPSSVLEFDIARKRVHPTQKPVALMEYLIKTYTNEGETVLDFTMGSGTTGVACKNLGRKFIGIELDKGYFDIARERINATH